MATRPGLEQVVGVASACLLRVLSRVGPTSGVVKDTRRRYIGVIRYNANFEGLFCHDDYNPCSVE